MLSKLASVTARGNLAKSYKTMTNLAKASFRSTQAVGDKLSIGEAAVVLEEKIAGISQVVSISSSLIRTTSSSSVMLSQSVMVLLECSGSPRYRLVRWLSSLQASKVWL